MTLIAHGTLVNEAESHDYPNTAVSRTGVRSVELPGGPLGVEIEYIADGIVASDEDSGIFGEGDTEAEALRELVEHLRLQLRDLSGHKDSLHPDLVPELARLSYLFGE